MKTGEQWFENGLAKYMASSCATAVEPLYQATLVPSENVDRAHLYLAHCQSIFGQNADAAYNLEAIKHKKLTGADLALYKTLKKKHEADIDLRHKLDFNASAYAGSSTTAPATVKGAATFFGAGLGVSRPTWSLGLFYESYAAKMVPKTYSSYSQSMSGAQAGYFILPSWHISGSFTMIAGSIDQLKSITVAGLQTDFYLTPLWRLFAEYYSSNYPNLVPDTKLSYKYPVTAGEAVVGLGFPIYNGATAGLNGTASYSSISLAKPSNSDASINKDLTKAGGRFEAAIASYIMAATASVSYWSGAEVLGVRARGNVINDTTDLHKNGYKLGLGYTVNPHLGLGASYSGETFESTDVDGTYKDFTSSTVVANVAVYW